MAENITITANWLDGSLSNGMISRQYDNNRYRVQFINYPLGEDEDLSLYLIVWMKTEENGQSVEQAPIELDSDQWIITNYYTQFVQSIQFQLCVRNQSGTFEAHSPIFNSNVTKSLSHDGSTQEIYVDPLFDAYKEYVDDLVIGAGAVVIDSDLDTAGAAADAKATGDAVAELNERLDSLGDGVPTEVRQALLTLIQSAAYAETGLTDEVAVIASWAATITAITLNKSSISISGANTSQLVATTTPTGGAVSWASSDTSVATVSSNGLVTGVGNGTATITASSGGKKATCSVTVSGFATLTGISAVYSGGSVAGGTSIDSLKTNLVVTASYSDSTTRAISSSDYTLSGALSYGDCTVTVTYGGLVDTFTVNVGLPSGYTAFDYVYNNTKALNSVIDTGIEGAYCGNEYAHELTFSLTENSNTSGYGVYGLRSQSGIDPTARIIWTKYANSENKFSLDYSGESLSGAYVFDLNTKYKSITANRRWTLNDVVVRENIGSDGYTPPSTGTVRLFGFATGTAGSFLHQTARIYEFKITEISTGTVVAHMIPCKNSNNVAGFYDVIRSQFYSAPTAGNVLAGNDA